MNKTGHTILLGGLASDSHSVGLSILRQSLLMTGYHVIYMGTQNRLEAFFELQHLCNVVMISSMDGHARHHLHSFPEFLKQYQAYQPLWYIGGNLNVFEGYNIQSFFLELGFRRAFTHFVDITTVLELLQKDLHTIDPVPDYSLLAEHMLARQPYIAGRVSDNRMDRSAFEKERREVCEHWKTGFQAIDMESNAEFLVKQPNFPRIQQYVQAGEASILIQPRSGVALIQDQIALFQAFKKLGVRVLSYQVDSFTRNNDYAGAELAIQESKHVGASTLNGFPVINHGVPALRRVISTVRTPLQTRHSTRDPRLLAEISYAGGVTAFEGGAICYNIPYYKNYPIDESIRKWQYIDRLTGLYHDRFGIMLDREFFGTLTGTLIPPCLAIATDIIEMILAAAQGVKCVSLGYAEQGHRVQDIAAIRTLSTLAREIITNLGYKDVQINTIFYQYMASFPEDQRRAEALIYNSAITAALSGATRVLIKTPVEASRIPLLADNAQGISLAMRGLADAEDEAIDEEQIAQESAIIYREAQSILDSVIMCGSGDIASGVVCALQKGYIDIPFAPSIYNKGAVMTARDTEGAVRFLAIGHLQFDRELRQFHEHKIQERLRAEGLLSREQGYLLIEKDVLQIARGHYTRWPLSGGSPLRKALGRAEPLLSPSYANR